MKNCIVTHPESSSDALSIAEFQVQMAWETEGVKLDLATVRQGVEMAMADPDVKGRYFIAKTTEEIVLADGRVLAAGSVVGSLFVTREWSDWHCEWYWWIQSVYISPDCRRQGIYRSMYGQVVAEAKEAHVPQVRLYVERTNLRAQKTYQSQGMQESHYLLYEADI